MAHHAAYKKDHPEVATIDEWVLGPEGLPFFTTQWFPKNEEPKAYILFVHGYAEHVTRYHQFFNLIASPPSSIHVTAYDQRGHGRTAYEPLHHEHHHVKQWKGEGKHVSSNKNTKRKTGGWAKVMPDIEFFVKRESERAKSKGKKLFLQGFSMGGGQVIAFATRPTPPPSPQTIALLSGVIAGGALIRQTNPAPTLQVKAGAMAAKLGLGDMMIPTPLNYDHLSHNPTSNDLCRADPLCEQRGTLKGLGDMLNGGMTLDSKETWDRWPKNLPLLMYHGDADLICDYKATKRFYDNVATQDKRYEAFEGIYHEVHNEPHPTPARLADLITEWVHAHIETTTSVPTTTSTAPTAMVTQPPATASLDHDVAKL